MPIAKVKTPDGKTVSINAPEGATSDQILRFAKMKYEEGLLAQGEPDSISAAPSSLVRDLKTGARGLIEGAAALPLMVGDLANTGINYGIYGVNKATDSDIPYLGMPSEGFGQALSSAGLDYEPGLGYQINKAAGGVMTSLGAGMAARPATAAGQAIQHAFTAAPVSQVAGAVTGPIAAHMAESLGMSPAAQAVAGIAGSVAPSAVTSSAPMAVRGALRGGEAGRQRIMENQQLFRGAGTEPSVGQAAETQTAQALESYLSKAPGGHSEMMKFAKNQADDLANTIGMRNETAGPVAAGRMIKEGVDDFVGSFKEKSSQLYGKLDELVPPNTPINVNNTLNKLNTYTRNIKGAESLSSTFTNPKVAAIRKSIIEDTSRGIRSRKEAVQSVIDEIKNLDEQISQKTRQILDQGFAEDVTARKLGSKFTDAGKKDSLVIQRMKSERGQLESVLNEQMPGYLNEALAALKAGRQLPYEALKELRTRIGYLMDSGALVSDIPQSQIKGIYGALSRDIENGIGQVDGASSVLSRANRYYRAGQGRIKTLENVVSRPTYEKIFQAATGEIKNGHTLISKVMRSLPKETRQEISSEILVNLGKATPGRQSASGDIFSTETFLTNWNKIPPKSKNMLFGSMPPKYRADMDKIARVAENIREGSKVFSNPSGTQPALSLRHTIAGSVFAAMMGRFTEASIAASAPVVNYGAAKLMTNPKFVSWLAAESRKPIEMLPVSLNMLANRNKEDQDIQEFVENMKNRSN